ncbi:MAG: YkvA family protein [Candidatus Hodarchaeales archaeon]
MLEYLKNKTKKLKSDTYTLYFIYKHSRVSWWKKVFLGMVIGYAFSPIDLIPDFIPILGYLDDLILVPIGIWLAIKLIPSEIVEECRSLSREKEITEIPVGKKTSLIIVIIWVVGLILLVFWILNILKRIN